MPSFLNKVFGYKKGDEKEQARPTSDVPDSNLLDGKYEAIPPMVSPTASSFPEAQQTRDSDRDTAFSLFKHKSLAVWQRSTQKSQAAAPHLTLRLPGPKENWDARALGSVFDADPVAQALLDDAVIAAKRLSPGEALSLIRACAQTISERGLETLGIMHPHWFSASSDVQRKLISLFIHSLTPTTLSPNPTAATSAFENELHYTRSPHDVAALLRWGLRHLTLENGHFGKDGAEWAWYNSFFQSERNASYPPKAFSELLLPQLPPSHVELLTVTLDLIASIAAHAETNGISGSKLSKFLGIWLLVATRAEEFDDWSRFYARWERAGRILEHLFLARLREESFGLRLPTRLQELVQHYPYNKGSPSTGDLLPRPRFSTRQYDALCIRVESVLTPGARQPKQNPIQLLLEAFRLPVESTSGDEHIALWHALKSTVFEDVSSSNPQFARIFVDETIQLLALIPPGNNASSPTLLASPITRAFTRKRSSSISKVLERALSKSTSNASSTPASPTSPITPIITDWAQFSLSGFGEAPSTQPLAVLFSDEDVEITVPRDVPRKSERWRSKSRSRRRRSEEHKPSDQSPQLDPEASIIESRVASVHVVHIDEAFIDFWSDAIIDPVSAHWPTFVLCGLKELPNAPLRWLLIEQTYAQQQPPRGPSPEGRRGRSPRPSFRSDITGFRINSVFSTARKRFSVFSKSTSDLDPKKGRAVAGELGEVLVEEDDPNKDRRMDGKTTISSGTTADIADQVKANEINAVLPIAVAVVNPASQSKDVSAAVEVPSIEPVLQSGAGQTDRCEPSLKIDRVADPLGIIDKADSQTNDPALQPAAAEDGRTQVEIPQDVVQANDVARPADDDAHLPVVITSDSQAVTETVVMPEPIIPDLANPIPLTDVSALDESPGDIIQPRVDRQPSREFSASAAAEAVQYEDAAEDRVSTEVRAQAQDAVPFVGGIKDIAETEIHTSAREGEMVVEETPRPEVEVDAQGLQVLEDDDAVLESPPAPAVEDVSVALTVESSPEIVEGAQDVPDQAEYAADHVSKFTPQEQATIVDTTEEPQVKALAVGILVEDEPRGLDLEIGVPTPVVETAAVVYETPGPQTATEEHAPIQLPTPKSEPPELADEVTEPLVEEADAPQSEMPGLADEVTEPLVEEADALQPATPGLADEVTQPLVEEAGAPQPEVPGPADEVIDEDEETEPLTEEAHTSIEAALGSFPEDAVTLAAAHDSAQTVQDPEAPRAAERLPLQEDDEEDVPEIAVHPVDVGAEPIVEFASDPGIVVESVEDGDGGEPETVGDESEVVKASLPVPVEIEVLSTVVGVPEVVVEETDKTNGIAGDVDIAAEQPVTSTEEPVAPFEECTAEA